MATSWRERFGLDGQRSIKNFLINPSLQFRIFQPYLIMLTLSAVLVDLVLLFCVRALYEIFPEMTFEQGSRLNDLIIQMGVISVVGLITMAILGFAATTVLSHRILGPLVPIKRHLKAMIDGDYRGKINLRKNDELKDLAADLNTLSEKLAPKS